MTKIRSNKAIVAKKSNGAGRPKILIDIKSIAKLAQMPILYGLIEKKVRHPYVKRCGIKLLRKIVQLCKHG